MAAAVLNDGMMSRLEGMNSDWPKLTFALLGELKNVWDFNDARAFSQIEFHFQENFELDTFSRSDYEHMIRSNGASMSTQVNMNGKYEKIIAQVADWSLAQEALMDLMAELPVSSSQMDFIRLANVKNSADMDFSLMADSMAHMFDNLKLNDDLRDDDLDGIIGVVRDKKSDRVIRNGAMLLEVE